MKWLTSVWQRSCWMDSVSRRVAKRHVSRCEAGTLLLSAAPAVLHSTSIDLRQCQNTNPRSYDRQSRGLLQQYFIPVLSLSYTSAVYSRCWTPRRAWLSSWGSGAAWRRLAVTRGIGYCMVRQRIDFKICLLVYKCLQQFTSLAVCHPGYLESMVTSVSAVSTSRHLRSAGQGDLVVPRTRTVGFGPQSFSVAGPSLWNTLPSGTKLSTLTVAPFCSWRQWCSFAVSTHERSRHNFD